MCVEEKKQNKQTKLNQKKQCLQETEDSEVKAQPRALEVTAELVP